MAKLQCLLLSFAAFCLILNMGTACRPTNANNPVCGNNGQTYMNMGHLLCANWSNPGEYT